MANIDERLDRLTERHEALSQSLQLLVQIVNQMTQDLQRLENAVGQTTQNMQRLDNALNHLLEGQLEIRQLITGQDRHLTYMERVMDRLSSIVIEHDSRIQRLENPGESAA